MKVNKEILNSRDAFNLLNILLNDDEQEHLIVVVLNNAMIAKSIHFVASGTDTSVPISSKMITKIAILNNASGVLLAHNHPTGKTTPSKADIEMTTKVKEALHYFEISLVDHIIIGENEYYSFNEESLKKTK